MKHPDWPAFLAAIIAEPDEDAVRLVAADFLDETGDPDRAAFIRVQVELARLESAGLRDAPEADVLRKKERAFLGTFSTATRFWAAEECPELVRGTPTQTGSLFVDGAERLTWRRGFVEGVACPAAQWLRCGVAVRSRNPVRTVNLTQCEPVSRDEWYAGLPALRGLPVVLLDLFPQSETKSHIAAWLQTWLPGTTVAAVPL